MKNLRKRLPGTAQPLSAIWSRIKKDAVQNTGETYYIGTEEEA